MFDLDKPVVVNICYGLLAILLVVLLFLSIPTFVYVSNKVNSSRLEEIRYCPNCGQDLLRK